MTNETAGGSSLPDGWRLVIALAPDADGELGGTAEIWQDREMRCRMVLTRYGKDVTAAERRVQQRTGLWISEWLSRQHSGSTGFANLDD